MVCQTFIWTGMTKGVFPALDFIVGLSAAVKVRSAYTFQIALEFSHCGL